MSYSADERLAAGTILGAFDGTAAPPWLLSRVEQGLGGVCLFAQNVVDDAQAAALCTDLHGAGGHLVIAIDEEGGDVTRLDAAGGSETPSPAAFGAVDDVALTRAAFATLGDRLHRLGIDLDLAPCADINSNERNPIIGVRSFGATASLAARHTVAAIDGFHDGGIAACVKHFPGHGDTTQDTHLGGARVDASLDDLFSRELIPFRAAVEAGVDAVLTAHIVVPEVDELPASISPRWTQLLRTECAFAGAVITDALDMGAISRGRGVTGVATGAVSALIAGADLLCLGSNFTAESTDIVVRSIAAAIVDGRLHRDALVASVERVQRLRERPRDRSATGSSPAALVARRAIRVTGSLPRGPYTLVECRPHPNMACFNVAWGVARHVPGWDAMTVGANDRLAEIPGTGPIAVIVREAEVHEWQLAVIDEAVATGRPTVEIELGWPSTRPTRAQASIVSFGAARSSTQAVADVLKES